MFCPQDWPQLESVDFFVSFFGKYPYVENLHLGNFSSGEIFKIFTCFGAGCSKVGTGENVCGGEARLIGLFSLLKSTKSLKIENDLQDFFLC